MSSQVRSTINLSARTKPVRRLPLAVGGKEIVAILVAAALIGYVLYYFFSTYNPERQRLQTIAGQVAELDAEIAKEKAKATSPQTQTSAEEEALNSLELFKVRNLKPRAPGEIALYRDINAMAKKHNLQLASGIEMAQSEGRDAEEDSDSSKKSSSLEKVFPETEVHFAVAGEYPQLRAFLNELEQNRQFLIIKALTLASEENRQSQEEGRSSRRSAQRASSALSLAIEMKVYFQP